MSVKVKCQLNPFSNEIETFETKPVSINKIIKKIDTRKAVNTGWRILVNDKVVTDFNTIPKDEDTVYIKLIPEGDQKQTAVGEKIAGAALTGLGVVVGVLTSWTGFGALAGASLVGAGISLFANGVVLYNTNIPTPKNKDNGKLEQSPAIRGSKNQIRPMGTIPILFGKRRIYADLAATPYTMINSNGEQYFYQLFCVGQKDLSIDQNSLKLGETNIVEYSASKNINTILAGQDALVSLSISHGECIPSYFSSCVHEEMINEPLKNKIEDGLAGDIIRTTPDDTQEINVDIFFNSGLGAYDDDGNLDIADVTVEAFYKLENESDSSYKLLGNFNGDSNTISGSELKTLRYSIHKSGLPAGKYTVKIVRQSPDHDNDSKIIDQVYVGSVRAIKNEQAISSERCRQLTLIGLKIKASSKLNNYVEHINFIAQSKLPDYSGYSSGASQWRIKSNSSNPASAAIYAMQGELSQQKLKDSEIDWPAFEKLYRWCIQKGYECNELVYENISISELLTAIASTCRAEIIRLNGKMTVIQDIEKSGFVQMFTPRNSWNYQERIVKTSLPDALSLQFPDAESGYAEQELKVYNTPSGNKAQEPEIIQDVTLWGVTSNVQARKLGMYKYAVSQNRPFIYQFSCDFEYMLCNKGDWIKYAGDVALAGITQGRIAELIYTNGVITGFISDEEIPMTEGKEYAIRIRRQDCSFIILRIVNNGETSNTVTISGEVAAGVLNEGDLFTFGYPEMDSLDLLITDIQCNEDNSADIIAVDYSPEIFGVDNPNFILPEFKNKITDAVFKIDGTTKLDLSDWQYFITYNDSKELPDAPTGNGSENGWHTYLTRNTRWQSSKRAKNINEGSWGAPVNIAYSDSIKNLYANHIVTLYRELGEGEAPMVSTGITSLLSYNFASNSIFWYEQSGSNGWSTQYPENPTRTVYVTSATAFGKSEIDNIAANEWAKPIAVGLNGVNGISIAPLSLYKRSLGQPEKPFISGTYCFNDGEFTWDDPTQADGWQRTIPPLDKDSLPIWETHVTAITTNDTAYQQNGKLYDRIDFDEWSIPEQYSANEIWSKAEIENFIKSQISDSSTPYIYAEPNQVGFAVNVSNYVPVSQTIAVKIHILQFNAEVDFILGDTSKIIPEGFSTVWDESTHELYITVQQAKRIVSQIWSLPLIFKAYKARWGYKQSNTSETVRYVNKRYQLLTIRPDNWDFEYTNYYISVNGIPVKNTNSNWIANTYYELIIEPYGSIIFDAESSQKTVQISVITIKGGRYLGPVASLEELDQLIKKWKSQYNGLIIGDYFAWTGPTIATGLAQGGQFENLCAYCWVNKTEYQWAKDNDRSHIAETVSDIVAAASDELEIARANPELYNYFNKLYASTLIAKKIVANQALIENLFAKEITLKSGGSIEAYDQFGRLGFGLYSDGHAVFHNVKIDGYLSEAELGNVPANVNVTEETKDGVTTKYFIVTSVNGIKNSYTILSDDTYLHIAKSYGSRNGANTSSYFKLLKDGTLEADNAVIHGGIYADYGVFRGTLFQGVEYYVLGLITFWSTTFEGDRPANPFVYHASIKTLYFNSQNIVMDESNGTTSIIFRSSFPFWATYGKPHVINSAVFYGDTPLLPNVYYGETQNQDGTFQNILSVVFYSPNGTRLLPTSRGTLIIICAK